MSCHRLQISLLNFSKRVKKFILSKPCKLTLKFTQSCPPMLRQAGRDPVLDGLNWRIWCTAAAHDHKHTRGFNRNEQQRQVFK